MGEERHLHQVSKWIPSAEDCEPPDPIKYRFKLILKTKWEVQISRKLDHCILHADLSSSANFHGVPLIQTCCFLKSGHGIFSCVY